MQKFHLLSQVGVTGPGPTIQIQAKEHPDYLRSYHVGMTGGQNVTVAVEASSDEASWFPLAIVSLSSSKLAEGFSSVVPWPFVRANVTSISGGGAASTINAVMMLGIPGAK